MRSFGGWLLAVALVACGAPRAGDDAGVGADAGVRSDSGLPTGDASTEDGGAEGDGDGVGRAMDCDDADPSIGSTAERACSSACGAGMERCTSGTWAACDAPTDCTCPTPGMMRLAPCTRCGMQSERCSEAGIWEAASECLDQGECEVAAVETRMTELCGTEQRLCQSTCTWGGWSTSEPDGECRPDDTEHCGPEMTTFRICGADCRWGDVCW